MNVFSLRTIIDDILLIVRNNNISESEDLSRDQIRAWVLAYKAYLAKKQQDKEKEVGDDLDDDDSVSSTIGPLSLQAVKSQDGCCFCLKRTKDKIPALLGNSDTNIISISDECGTLFLIMDAGRRKFHCFRRYTYNEPCARFEDGYVYILGDVEDIAKIYITGNFVDGDELNGDEDDVIIPGWMVPDIKKAIMDNELAFMLKRPSDDSNNSTLAGVKPHGPQDKEK